MVAFLDFNSFILMNSSLKEKESVGDWRKNIDEKAGMDGRKKMFEGEA